MPQKSAPELFAVVHYLHRLSTEGKRGAKMALESCPKCHFIMLEGVLMTIEEHGQNGTIYVSDLAAAVKQPLPAVSRALRQLEQDGLIERITDPNDRRKTLVRPTEKGLDASRQVEAAISRYFERVICRIPEEQREQAAAEALEYEKAKKELKKQDAEIDRKGKIAALFCKAYEKAVLLTPSEENVRCWTDGTRMTPEEMQDTVKESRELAEVFRTIADIIEQKILPADWRCADAESEENDAQSDGNPA